MEKEQSLQKNTLEIDSLELLIRFLIKCKSDAQKNESKSKTITSCSDIVAAVYYYRKYPNVNDFIQKYMKKKEDYFQLQWTRATWATLSKMSEPELSDLVMYQIQLVDNSQED
ncbi:MAG: hypothetical protein HY094_05200 [Candidatus Melainabacteria bacterium]|nr:hypothetical protein [Candidatus Melainabacteria bacterium]